MIPMSIIEKLKTIFDIVSSSPFFFISFIIAVILLILVIISLKKYKKVNTKLFVISWLFITGVLVIKYYSFIIALADSFIENVFMAIYFPNLAVFTIVLLITNISLFHSILKKDKDMVYRIIQITTAILIDFLFILILDTVVKNNIDIYSQTEVYQNTNLFVLLESSMAIFTIDVALNVIIFIIKKLLNYKKEPIKQDLPQQNISTQATQQQTPVVERPKSNIQVVPAQITQSIPIATTNVVTPQYKPQIMPEVNVVPAVNNVNRVNNSFINNTNNTNTNNTNLNQGLYAGTNSQSFSASNVKIINNNNSILDNSVQFNNIPKQNEFMPINTPTQVVQTPSILNTNISQNINRNQSINQSIQSQNNSDTNTNYFIPQNNQNDDIEKL